MLNQEETERLFLLTHFSYTAKCFDALTNPSCSILEQKVFYSHDVIHFTFLHFFGTFNNYIDYSYILRKNVYLPVGPSSDIYTM